MKRDITTFFIVTAKYRIDTHKNSMLINKNTKIQKYCEQVILEVAPRGILYLKIYFTHFTHVVEDSHYTYVTLFPT